MKKIRVFLANIGERRQVFQLVTPPLGIMYLAAYIRSKFPSEFRLVNQKLHNVSNDALVRMAVDFKADIVGLSVLTSASHNLSCVTKKVKELLPDALMLLGGPHVSAFGEKSLEGNAAHAAVPGEGELALEVIIRHWFEGDGLKDVPGIFRREKDGAIVTNPGRMPFIQDVDTLPPPAYDLIDLPAYWKRQPMPPIPRRRYAALFSSRGCPYKCAYCHRIFGDTFRGHSAERIVDEIAFLSKTYGISDFEFLDDIFNLDRKRLMTFCDLIHRRNLKTRLVFPNGVRTDIFTQDEIEALAGTGMYFASFALESGSPRIQSLVKKNLNIGKFLKNVETAVRCGVYANGFAMMGFPTETEEEMQMTIDVACDSRLHTISFFTVTPFPNTEIYNMARRLCPEKVATIDYTDMEYAGITVNVSAVPDDVLYAYQRKANRAFFLNPLRMMRIVRDFPQPHLLPLYLPVFLRRASKGLH
ncbi:MAG: B12-binding domain-containing radical SAM protein [Thermodesulfobacteriota bacterium]